MAKVLKDLSQLPRSSFKPSDPVKETTDYETF